MTRFVGIPNVPTEGMNVPQLSVLNALKQNVELLAGIRGESDSDSAAVLKGSINTSKMAAQSITKVTAIGAGFTIDGVNLASAEDFGKLVSDVQLVINDMTNLRDFVTKFINNLKG